jgi:Zn-dependent protease
MNQQFGPLLYAISIWALPAIIAITFHEAAHGFAALRLGDDTASRLGRVTFNPLKHIDLTGTILLPALLLSCALRSCLAMRSRSRSTSGRCAIHGAT